MKIALQSIIHKGVVHNIFKKYTLLHFQTKLGKTGYSDIREQEMQCLKEQLKQVSNMHSLKLNLSEAIPNLKNYIHFKELVWNLTNLQNLQLNLNNNKIGDNSENMKQLYNTLKGLKKLKSLNLNLSQNNLSDNAESMEYLSQALRRFTMLKNLELDLCDNELQKHIYKLTGLSSLKNLKSCKLDLARNGLGLHPENLQFLGEQLKKMNLESLKLVLDWNLLGVYSKNLQILADQLTYFKNLKVLELRLEFNDIYLYKEDFKALGKGLGKIEHLEYFSLYLRGNRKRQNEKQVNFEYQRDLYSGLIKLDNLKAFESYFTQEKSNLFWEFLISQKKLEKLKAVFSDDFWIDSLGLENEKKFLRLKYLDIKIQQEIFEVNISNFKAFMNGMKRFPRLETLNLDLSGCCYLENSGNVKDLTTLLGEFDNLKCVRFNLFNCMLEFNVEIIKVLFHGLKNLNGLESLYLDLLNTDFGTNLELLKALDQGIGSMGNLNKIQICLMYGIWNNQEENLQILWKRLKILTEKNLVYVKVEYISGFLECTTQILFNGVKEWTSMKQLYLRLTKTFVCVTDIIILKKF